MSSNIQTDETSGETSDSVKRCTRDCQDRRPGCHSGCEIYAKQRAKWDRITEGKRKEYETILPAQTHYFKSSNASKPNRIRYARYLSTIVFLQPRTRYARNDCASTP